MMSDVGLCSSASLYTYHMDMVYIAGEGGRRSGFLPFPARNPTNATIPKTFSAWYRE